MQRFSQILSLLLVFSAVLLTVASPATADSGGETVIYLVRHAEKVLVGEDGEAPKDPALTEAGEARARALAHVLEAAEIDHVHSTDTRRTRDTAAPSAEAAGIDVAIYDGRALEAFAARLRSTPGRHLVVGHSNTTPALVEHLGGEPGPPIEEANEYDRLYVLVFHGDESAVTTLSLRFGSASPEEDTTEPR